MTHEAFPDGLALVETCDGRWYSARAPSAENSLRSLRLLDGPLDIPPALDLEASEGYEVREEAIAACWAWWEATLLPLEWQALASRTEVYPERNAWYLEEITQLTGQCGAGLWTLYRGQGGTAAGHRSIWGKSRRDDRDALPAHLYLGEPSGRPACHGAGRMSQTHERTRP